MRVTMTDAERKARYELRLAANLEAAEVHPKFAWWPIWVRDTGGRVWLQTVWRYADLYDSSCSMRKGEIMWFNHFTTKEAADSSLAFMRKFNA